MDDAGRGRHHAEVGEGLLAPAQELVPLAVPLELELRRFCARASCVPNTSTCTEWSTTRSTGTSGLIRFGSCAEPLHRGPHGGEVDDRGDAGEVLQDHAGGHEGELDVLRGGRVPGAEVLHVVRGDQLAVDDPQDGLEERRGSRRAGGRGRGRHPPSRGRRGGRSWPGRSRCRGWSGRRTHRSSWLSSLLDGFRAYTSAPFGRDGRALGVVEAQPALGGAPDADAARHRDASGRPALPERQGGASLEEMTAREAGVDRQGAAQLARGRGRHRQAGRCPGAARRRG